MSQQGALSGSGGGGSGGFTTINVQTFTTTGTYTPTAGMKYCFVQQAGGGAAGGGADTSALSAGAAGGNGEYAEGYFSAASIGASQAVTIGAGGVGVSGLTGGNGGTTSLGTLMTALGGHGGAVISTAIVGDFTVAGGVGGTGGTGGSVRIQGSQGGFAYINFHAAIGMIFAGGSSPGPFTAGVKGATVINGTVVQATDGSAGTGFGCGGSGALDYQNGSNQTGGNGSAGYMVITEYI